MTTALAHFFLNYSRQFPKILLTKLSGTHFVVYRSGLDEHYSDLSEPWSISGELFCSRKWRAEIWYPGETFQNNFFELLTYPIAE